MSTTGQPDSQAWPRLCHELRTSITPVLAGMELLAGTEAEGGQDDGVIDVVAQNVARAERLLADVRETLDARTRRPTGPAVD